MNILYTTAKVTCPSLIIYGSFSLSGEALNQSYFLFLVPIGILGNALSFMVSIVYFNFYKPRVTSNLYEIPEYRCIFSGDDSEKQSDNVVLYLRLCSVCY